MKVCNLFILLCVFQISFAQFNDTTNYYLNYTSTAVINKTNAGSSYVLNNSLRFNVYKKNISLNTTNSWIYGKQQDNLTNNDFSSALDFDLYKTLRNFYYWGLVNYEKSYSLKINQRLQAGLGVGYNIINKENAIVLVSDGILYEKSDLFDGELSDNEYEIFRNSLRLKFRFIIAKVITLDCSNFVQHSLSDKKDYILKSDTHMSVKLRKWLRFTTTLMYNKLNRTNRENLLFTFGLTAERYF